MFRIDRSALSVRRRVVIRGGDGIKLYHYPSDKLYYCIDNSYGLGFYNRRTNPQYDNGEVIGAEGSEYIIIGECNILADYVPPYPRQRLDTIVESVSTGERYLVQRRMFVEVEERDYEKILELQYDVRNLEKAIRELRREIRRKNRELAKEMI